MRDYNDDENSLLVPFPVPFSQHDFNGYSHALEPHVEILSGPPNPIPVQIPEPTPEPIQEPIPEPIPKRKRGRPRRNTIMM